MFVQVCVRQLSVTGCVCAGACQAVISHWLCLCRCMSGRHLLLWRPQPLHTVSSGLLPATGRHQHLCRMLQWPDYPGPWGHLRQQLCWCWSVPHHLPLPPVFLPCNSTSPIDSSLPCNSTSPTDSTIFMFGMLKFCFCNAPLVKKDAMFVMTFRVSLWSMFVDVFQLR